MIYALNDMNPRGNGKGRSKYANLILAPLLSLSLISNFLNPCFAEDKAEKEFNVKFRRQDYNVSLNEDKFLYKIEPDASSEIKKEVLASVIIENEINEIQNKKEVLEDKIDKFLSVNPSKMDLNIDCNDVNFKISNESPIYSEQPKLNVSAEKEGKKLEVKWILDSQDYVARWQKNSGIIISHPKDVKLIRRFDRIFELDVNSGKNSYGVFNIKEVSFHEEREVAGMLLNSFIEGARNIAKEDIGIVAQAFIGGIEFEEWLEGKERDRRENIIKSKVAGTKWVEYQPTAAMPDGFQSPFEVGRMFSVEFDGPLNRIDFFINTNLYQNPLNVSKEITSTKNDKILLKMISAYINEPTEKTTAGRLVKLGRTIEDRIEEFLGEYKDKKLHDLGEKEGFYYKLKLWNAEIYPFVTLLEGVKDKKLEGSLGKMPEYNKYIQNVKGIQNAIMPLQSILIKYNEKKSRTRATKTMQYIEELSAAIMQYGCKNGKYPDDLEILVVKGYISELKNDEWGNEIKYNKSTSEKGDWSYDLISSGKDGKFSTQIKDGDDVILAQIHHLSD